MRKLILGAVLLVSAIFTFSGVAQADSVVFRDPDLERDFSGNMDGTCYGMTINETMTAKVNGKTGAGCEFSVDVVGAGEWVDSGSYFNTPPYAWGANKFYSGVRADFSYTCTQPTYGLDKNKLPSYVKLVKEEEIASEGSGPKGRRYHFTVSEGATEGNTFNAAFNFKTNCEMYKKEGSSIEKMVSVDKVSKYCGQLPTKNLNPRGDSTTLPIKIGASCAPPTPTTPPNACGVQCTRDADCTGSTYSSSNTCIACVNNVCQVPPTPTPTLIPNACGVQCTRDADCTGSTYSSSNTCIACVNNVCQVPPTPTPTSSPTPTSTPTPTPPPFDPAMCKCDGINYTDLYGGQPATITAFAKVEGEETQWARVAGMEFILYEGSATSSKILQRSGDLPANVIDTMTGLTRYSSVWNMTLPVLTQGVDYRIQAQIDCQPNVPTTMSTSNVMIAQATQNLSFIDRIFAFFARLFTGSSTNKNVQPTPTSFTPAGTSDTSVSPSPRQNLQLDTIYPVQVDQKTCTFIKFRASTLGGN